MTLRFPEEDFEKHLRKVCSHAVPVYVLHWAFLSELFPERNEKEQFSIDVILSTLVNSLQEIWSRHSEELLTKGQRNEFYSDFLSSEGHGHFCQ